MSIRLKTAEDIQILREGGKHLAEVVATVAAMVRPGITPMELDQKAADMIASFGDTPAFKGYRPQGAAFAYPATLCVSVDDEIVHGIPDDEPLEEGSIVSIDCGLVHQGLITDHAVTVPVGKISNKLQNLLDVTQAALERGIQAAVLENTIGDIGHAIAKDIPNSFGIIRELAGHGVGYAVHEDPYVPNYGRPGTAEPLQSGLVIAIEPMLTLGTEEIDLDQDGYTLSTADQSYSAHFEHTIAITDNGPVVLTKI
jgi:methionyl aminopeptidase